jgi:hypothetical protein
VAAYSFIAALRQTVKTRKENGTMKKMPTIFNRNPANMSEILPEHHPDCEWIFNNEGIATRKYDGTCVKIENGEYFKRREVKKGKMPPSNFVEEEFDKNTGKRVGWVPVDPNSKEDRWHMEALDNSLPEAISYDGTYELVGPKIQGNPEGCEHHILLKHEEAQVFENVPRTFEGIEQFMRNKDIEGIVFHHPDGRMGKIKKKDYGQKRKCVLRGQ